MGKAASTVLVVDSDAVIGPVISDGLESCGYLVSTAETGGAGLSTAVHMTPDVILLDPDLPDMSGIEFLNMIRSWSAVPIIILSCRPGRPNGACRSATPSGDQGIPPGRPGEGGPLKCPVRNAAPPEDSTGVSRSQPASD
jgi:Response regulator receiver domain